MANYQYSLRQVIWGIGITALFPLRLAARARSGDDNFASPADAASAAARARAKAFFENNFEIIAPEKP